MKHVQFNDLTREAFAELVAARINRMQEYAMTGKQRGDPVLFRNSLAAALELARLAAYFGIVVSWPELDEDKIYDGYP